MLFPPPTGSLHQQNGRHPMERLFWILTAVCREILERACPGNVSESSGVLISESALWRRPPPWLPLNIHFPFYSRTVFPEHSLGGWMGIRASVNHTLEPTSFRLFLAALGVENAAYLGPWDLCFSRKWCSCSLWESVLNKRVGLALNKNLFFCFIHSLILKRAADKTEIRNNWWAYSYSNKSFSLASPIWVAECGLESH